METPPEITFKDTEKSPAVETLVRERIARLEKFYPRIITCRVVIEVPHRSSEGAKPPLAIAVEVQIPGRPTLVAKDMDERREMKGDHTAAINRCFEAMERQLRQAADIQQRGPNPPASSGETGVIRKLFAQEGYGFVEVGGSTELYFARDVVMDADFDELEPGMVVNLTRASGEGPMGPQASVIKVLNRRKTPA